MNDITTLMEKLKEHTLQYAIENGVQLDGNGFVSCLYPDHPDRDPSMKWWDEANVFHCFGCLTEDEEVFTYEKGYIPIKNIEKGMTTLGLNGKPNRILYKNKIEGTNKKIYGIKTGAGSYLTKVTEEHKHFVINYKNLNVHKDGKNFFKNKNNRKPRIKYRKKELKIKTTIDLEAGDYVFIPKTSVYNDGILYNDWKVVTNRGKSPHIINKITLNEDICWLFGIYLAEGSLYRGGVKWTIGGEFKELAFKIQSILEKNFNLYSNIINRTDRKNIYEVTCSCTDLRNFIKKYFGELCDQKFIHPYFLHIDYKLQKSLLNGIYDGDGCNQKHGIMTTLKLSNKNIINAIKLICINNNITFGYSEKEASVGNDGILRKPIYILIFRKQESGRFLIDKLDNGQEGAFILIEKILELPSVKYVYDITTDDNSFLTKNFMTHNCGRILDIFGLANIFENKPLAGPDFVEKNVFYLAKKYGVPYEHLQREMTAEEIKRQLLYRSMKLFADYVVQNMNKDYLAERKITEDTARKLLIGSVKSFKDCKEYLIKIGCNEEILKEIGLNSFRVNEDKMIFIIKDEYGRPCSFVAREMKNYKKGNGIPKYSNGDATMIFDKSKIFYGWSDIKSKYNPLNTLVIIEGYIDEVTTYQYGYTQFVALGSASLTDEHIKIIERNPKIENIAFALDNDETGRKRMKSLIDRLKAMKTSKKYKFAVYKTSGKDLDEILNEAGKKISLQDIFELKSLFDYELMNLKEELNSDLDESNLFDRFVGIISKTTRPKEREEQARILSKYLNNYSYETILEEVKYLLSAEEMDYKKEMITQADMSFQEIKQNPDYALTILDNLKEQFKNVNIKYKKNNTTVFERCLNNFKSFEENKKNFNLFNLNFYMEWLNDLSIFPGHVILLSALANVGKFKLFCNS